MSNDMSKVVMNKPEQIKALENGNGIQYLLDSAYKIFNNPLYVVDADYNLLAFTEAPVDDPIWAELITTGTYSMEALESLAKERFIENFLNAEKTMILKSDRFKYRRLSGHIHVRGNKGIGLVAMYEFNTSFDPECIEAFGMLSDKISDEIRDYEYFITLMFEFHEDRINKLLDTVVKNPFLYNPQAQMLYDDFDDYLYVAVVSPERNNILEHVYQSRLAYFKSMLKTKFQLYKYSVYADYIVMLMSSKHSFFNGARFFTSHAALFEQNGLFMGISGSFENIYELRKYYDQAICALTNGLANNDGQRIFLHNDAG